MASRITPDPATLMFDRLAGLGFASFTPHQVEAIESAVLDHLVCAVRGQGQAATHAVLSGVDADGGVVTEANAGAYVYGRHQKVPVRLAALANATASHTLELDDLHLAGMLHPGVCVVPATIAAHSHYGGSGRSLLVALAVGYEVMMRIANSVGGQLGYRGFHLTGLLGPMGAAAGVSKVRGGTAAQMATAVKIAASLGGGIKAFQQGPGMVKSLHAGQAAASGLLAAQLAFDGFEAPSRGLIGRFGALDVFSLDQEADAGALVRGEDTHLMIEEIYIKPFAACAANHGPIIAALALRERHEFRVEDVVSIRIGGARKMAEQNSIPVPKDAATAQYSVEYCVALALTGRVHDLDSFLCVDRYSEPAVRALMEKATVDVDSEADGRYPASKDGRVTLTFADGRRLSAYGTADQRYSSGWNAAISKAEYLWGGRIPDIVRQRTLSLVQRLKEGGSLDGVLPDLKLSA